ncbi:MAG: class I SAM-dependent methyltransferase, partial [Planctomycetales bacterium]|nr:class I SAM-dependent methyltransferase [Planctomycetales bacterium]
DRRLKVLNLFAYTGGSTLAAAAAGAEVTHVDSSKSVVTWARRNAELSNLCDAPIRWIVDDCTKFVQRELRRENFYDAVILDPPSYGHGAKGGPWKLSHDLMPLLDACASLTSRSRAFLLLTCHSPGFGPAELSACLEDTFFGHCQTGAQAKRLFIRCDDGRKLDAGAVARWPS